MKANPFNTPNWHFSEEGNEICRIGGKRGGMSRSETKRASSRINAAKARAAFRKKYGDIRPETALKGRDYLEKVKTA